MERDKILLAALLALKNLKATLNESVSERLYEVGEQLELDPDDWDFIKDGLLSTIADFPPLSEQFQSTKQELDLLDSNFRSQLLPDDKELAELFRTRNEIERRGGSQGDSSLANQKIVVVAWKYLKQKDPVVLVKESSWLERVERVIKNK